MTCVIIEDELPAQELLQHFIEKTADLECLGTYGSVAEVEISKLAKADCLFLDIQLPGLNGLEFLKQTEMSPKVIVTTAYRDYAIDAYEEAVVDYLLKPFSYQRFLKAVMRVANTETATEAPKEESSAKELFVYADKTFYKINKNTINYLEAAVDYVELHYDSHKKLLVQDSMNNWEEKLKDDGFVRVHRSYLINFNKIEKIVGNSIYIGTKIIPIGKTHRKAFFERLS